MCSSHGVQKDVMSGESPKEGGLRPGRPAQEASQPCVWGEAGEPRCVLTELGSAGSAFCPLPSSTLPGLLTVHPEDEGGAYS